MAQGCGEWSQVAIGSPLSGSAQFDACAPGTLSISSAGSGSSTADRQYMVQRELCGDGEIVVKIESVSNGRAGLEIRADNTPGAVKAGLKTPLSNMLTRYIRNAAGDTHSAQSSTAQGHRWLKLVRSGNNIQLFWSANGSNWTSFAPYSNMALPNCALLGIYVESNNAAVATGVFSNLSVSGFSAPGNTPVTTFSFAAGSLSAEAGQEVQVCVNIADPCACAPASVQVALQGNGAPHLSGFSAQTLEFQAGDTQKCFSLSTAAEPGEGLYTLVLQNPTGGNAAAIGAQSALAVAVTGEPETPTDCPWAGPDREICRGESVVIGCPDEVQPPAGSFYCYRWTPEEGLDDPSLPQPTAAPQETTTYTLYVTDNQGNVVATDGVMVRVRPLPEAAISAEPSPPIIVNGAPVTLTALSDPGAYMWELEGVGPVPGSDLTVLTVSIGGEYIFRVTNEFNCSSAVNISVANGNDEDACAEALRYFFLSKGFLEIPITIIGSDPGFTADPEEARLKLMNPCLVQDEAQLVISLGEDEFNIATPLISYLDESNPLLAAFTGNSKAVVTKNDNFCLNLILSGCGASELSTESVEAYFADVTFGYWAHVWKAPAGNGESALFISGRSPLTDNFWTTSDPPISSEATLALDYVKSHPLHPDAAFPSRDKVIVNNAFDILAATSIQEGIDLNIPASSSIADCTTPTDRIFLSSAGVPLRVVAGSVATFGIKTQFSDLIDPRALGSFTVLSGDLWGNYRGMVRLPGAGLPADRFEGYKNLLTGKFYEYPGAAISGPQTVRLGVRVHGPGCPYFYIHSIGFTPNNTYPSNQNRTGAGALVADFNNGPSGTFSPIDPETFEPEYISLCLPPVSYDAFRNPLAIQINPPNNPIGQGWFFLVQGVNGAIQHFYGYYDPNSIDEHPLYQRFTCNGWEPFDTPHRPTYDFLSALIQVLSETGHLALDVFGIIPVIGEPADFINGIWYSAEGNLVEAGLSFAGVIPVIGANVTAGKYVFKIADNAGNTRTLNKFLKAKKGAGGAELLKINGQPVSLSDWVGIKTLQNNYTPQQAQKYAEWMFNLKAPGAAILKLFDESPAMFNVWKALEEAGASPAQWERLFIHLADLPANAPLLTRFTANPAIAKGWKLLDDLYGEATANKRLWDGDLIAKTTELSDNTVFMQRLGADAETQLSALKSIISKNALAGCNVCVPPTRLQFAYLKSIDQYLDDVQYFITQLGDKPGAGTLISLMKNGGSTQIDAIAQTIRLLKENPGGKFAPGNVVRFEPKLSNTVGELASDDGINQVGDILVELASGGNKLYELKSYIKSSLSGIPTGLLNQFKAYLNNNNVTNMSRLEYIFDKRKLLKNEFENLPNFNPANYFDDVAQAEQAIKGQFQVMMQQNANSIFQTVFNNASLRTSLSLSNDPAVAFNQFNSLVNNSNSALFQFIRVE